VTKIKSLRQARLKSLRPSRRKPRNHRLTDEPLTGGPSQISTPRFGLVHALQAEPFTTKPPDIGREPKQAAEAGNATAALELGATYDPLAPSVTVVWGVEPIPDRRTLDVVMARLWYEKARDLGSTEAAARLERLRSVPGPVR
jgi:hypothetical protein